LDFVFVVQLLKEGAVVWLYSKAAGKTLRIQENGKIDASGCNGKFGMHATRGTTNTCVLSHGVYMP